MSGTNQSRKVLYKRRAREERAGNEMSAFPRQNVDTPSAPSPQLTPIASPQARTSAPSPSPPLVSRQGDNRDTTNSTSGIPHSNIASDATPLGTETQTCDRRPLLTIAGYGFLPSHVAAQAISELFRNHYIESWTSWKKIPEQLRTAWFDQFMLKFTIDSPDHGLTRRNFEMRGAALLKVHLKKEREKGERPDWLGDQVWDGLCRHWQSDGFKKISSIAKANRASDGEGSAGPTHVGGSISMSQHRFNMEKERGVAPSPVDVFRRTHQRQDGSWASKKSEALMEKFDEEISQQNQSANASGGPTPSVLDVWCDVVGIKKGQIYGLGSESAVLNPRPRYRGSSSTSTDLRRELEETRVERNQLKDDLAKTNKKVEDLEQKYDHIVRLLEATPPSFQFTPRSSAQQQQDGGDDDDDDDETQPPSQPFQ